MNRTAGDSLYGGLLPINVGPPCSEKLWCTKTKRRVCNLAQCLVARSFSSILLAAGAQGAHGEQGTHRVSPSALYFLALPRNTLPNTLVLFLNASSLLALSTARIVTFKCV